MQKFNKRNTFALRKLSMGVSSIMIASGLFIVAGQDGQAAENAQVADVQQQDITQKSQESNEAQIELKQQGITQTQPQETKKVSGSSDSISLNDKPETSESPLVKQPASSEKTKTDPTEVDYKKVSDTLPQTPPVTEKVNSKTMVSEKDTSQTAPTEKPELDPEFSVVDRQNKDKDLEEQTKPAQKPELDPEFSVVDQQNKDKNPKNKTEQQSKATEAPKKDVKPKPAEQTKKVVAPRSKATAQPARTTSHGQTQTTPAPTITDKVKSLVKSKFINRDPIIFVHGFSGLVGDNAPKGSNYWGGTKYKMIEDLRNAGYNVFEASVSAFGSNWDRASELYAYIKGGIVDYGAAHATKYGHERYGRTYEGILPNWHPGQRIHLVGHSMGGQTIRLLEQLLRQGDPEEIAYQKEHGGTISELFQGHHDNMVTSITTIATPHNGTVASDDLGNTEFIKRLLYEYNIFAGRKGQKIDYGLKQWGLAQREGETYAEYAKRVSNSPLFTSKDTALYDLTREGASILNTRVDLNPDVYYKSYTGSATYETIFGTQIADPYMNIGHVLTGDLIGMTDDPAWRENDGLVSVVSSQHPDDEAFENVDFNSPAVKGIWQVTPTLNGWDHTDFTGQDALDWHHPGAELQKFYHDLVEDLVRKEA
ncbi:TPA: YSIRK-type signal peptide-containing protein [Staphylococcus delphini]|nr:YSIRK-type signal peptide-containing protein [Staphylococcus delphini]HEC2150690.1 YSIRK-type signal peptide-containing protein [Staphylococcus delphini]HEC2179079.1 YSIRK-type signal peptide-containing protein [Staphylococcus delphini]HEC2181422.1 YSIRK-type signal peptide-containing protein [Staphylococcus delphini]HEC2203498.1 YSIRK-type signal peptide-containing protein [Staphylococcus delphini]